MADEKRITVRVDPNLHKRVRLKAVTVGKPISDIVRELLEQWLADDPPEEQEVNEDEA